MKHAHLVLDEELLEEVLRVSGERTYTAAVTRAMRDFVSRARAGRILELAHRGAWEGDLAEMRRDSPPPQRRKKKAKRTKKKGGGRAAG